ncbi:MAG: DNA-directed RNA polymerase [Nanoarchaeota archaeon]|nr:DNA-directed RNA polymerase [Nanoarchaeota archaeon]
MGRGNNRGKEKSGSGKRGSSTSSFIDNFSSNWNYSSRPREMHKAVCADCGSECDVPFKPIEGKPIYCRACYSKHKQQR